MFRSFVAMAALGVMATASTPAKADWTVNLGDQLFNDTSVAFGGTIKMTFHTIVSGSVQISIEHLGTAPSGSDPLRIMSIVFNIDPGLFGLNGQNDFVFGPFSGPQPAGTDIIEDGLNIS